MSVNPYETPTRRSSKESHPYLIKFRNAKTELAQLFTDVNSYLDSCYLFFEKDFADKFEKLLDANMKDETRLAIERVEAIRQVIDRNQMKCAFFGRTSNGKSSVINAMLRGKILPSGMGHTTSCFVQVEGTDEDKGFLSQGDREMPIDDVQHLAHALSKSQLASDALLRLYWPSQTCVLLREDVVLLDSPGVNMDPDMDTWIDRYCLDADVFVLVVNAESTLMQAEKDFFHRVRERLSKPNVFILNNRWDASATEGEFVEQIRAQHMERCVAFLVDELRVCSRDEALERVFFVSARETLAQRLRSIMPGFSPAPGGTPATPQSPHPAAVPLAEGWESRQRDFETFEKVVERILSTSATKTKFAAHAEQGRELASRFRAAMERLYEICVEEKDSALKCRDKFQQHLEQFRARFTSACQELDAMTGNSLVRVEEQVSKALSGEIRRLGELVERYDRNFSSHPAALHLYKKELNEHIEKELGRKITQACFSDISNEVARAEKTMIQRLARLVTEEKCQNSILQCLVNNAFQPEFRVDCRNLCADFREDISFHFSLGWSSLVHRYSTTQVMQKAWSRPEMHVSESSLIASVLTQVFPSLRGRRVFVAVAALGLTARMLGGRALLLLASLYGGLYAYEYLSWTDRAKEQAFKRQYVAYACDKLRLIVDLTSTNARHQVKQELNSAMRQLTGQVEAYAGHLEAEIATLDTDMNKLTGLLSNSKRLKSEAQGLDEKLVAFCEKHVN